MRGRFLVLLIFLLGALVGLLQYKLKPRPTEDEINRMSGMFGAGSKWQGKIAPNFEAPTLHNQNFNLSENVGKKVIVLDFFATWCGPCRIETPELVRYYNEHRHDPILMVGVDGDEKPQLVQDFVAQSKIEYPVLIGSGALEKQYGVTAFPTTVIVGVDGRIELYQVGAIENTDVAFDPYLKLNRQLLAQNRAVTRQDYLRAVALPSPKFDAGGKKVVLGPRAQRIAAEMYCPCGCDKRIADCNCHTAQEIKAGLAVGKFGRKSDAEIIKELDRKYCMAGM
jgi:thiol-disulfide isomerase/thioredoxin